MKIKLKRKFFVGALLFAVTTIGHSAGATYCSGTTCYNVPVGSTINGPYGSSEPVPPSNTLPLGVLPASCVGSQTIYKDVPATYYPQTGELVVPLVNVIGSPIAFRVVKIQFDNGAHQLNVTHFE